MKAVLLVAGGVLVFTVAILLGFFFSGQSGGTPDQAYFTTPDNRTPEREAELRNCKGVSNPQTPVCATIREINSAKKVVYIAMYESLDNNHLLGQDARKQILDAIGAKSKTVNIYMREDDRFQTPSHKLTVCYGNSGSDSGIMHDKFLVIDHQVVITGSLNWNASSIQDNDENIVIIRDKGVAKKYEQRFQGMWESKHAQKPKDCPSWGG